MRMFYLRNGSTYDSKIWHVDARHPCAGPLWDLLSIGVIVGKKMKLF